jgi:hypothetical protein
VEIKRVCCFWDTALDRAAVTAVDPATGDSPLGVYVANRDEKTIAPFIVPGKSPTWFNIKHLSRYVMHNLVCKGSTQEDKFSLAFQYGVTLAENVVDANNQIVNQVAPTGKTGDTSYWTNADLELFSEAEILEVGAVVYNTSFLAPRAVIRYALPFTSQEITALLQ